MPNKVDVTIMGDRYKLNSAEKDAETLSRLAANLDARMKKTAEKYRLFNNLQISILTSLQMAEEYESLKKDYDELIKLLKE